MNYIVLLLCLFPIAFMLHDFEEIIVLPKWMARNANILRTRFPFLKKQIAQLQGLSMTGFVIAVAGETSAPIRIIPVSSRSLRASSPTLGMSLVISSSPSLVFLASDSYSSIYHS